jgi:hypothetical protein
MEAWLGTSLPVFLGLSVLVGGTAWLTGQAIAASWRPAWQVGSYCLLLALGWRFLSFALFEGQLLSLSGFIANLVVLLAVGLAGYRITHVKKMITQYPWLYQPRGPWRYERRPPTA